MNYRHMIGKSMGAMLFEVINRHYCKISGVETPKLR